MSSYKHQHTAPKTYLKSWENPNNHNFVWYYNNSNKTYYDIKVNKIIYEHYMYSLTLKEDLSILEKHFLTRDDFIDIFKPLNTYLVKYNGSILNKIDDFADNYLYFADWLIFDKNDKQISESNKNDLKRRIFNTKSHRLEKKLSVIENKWDGIKAKIESLCNYYIKNSSANKHQDFIYFEDIKLFKLFIDLQYSRTTKSYETFLQTAENIMDMELFDFIINKESEVPARATFLKMMDKGLKTDQFLLGQILNNANIKLIIANQGQLFFTSDIPVFAIKDDYYNKILQQKGIYMPITPKIIAVLFGKDNQLLVSKNLSDKVINSINQQIIINSQKGFVSCIELKDIGFNKKDS